MTCRPIQCQSLPPLQDGASEAADDNANGWAPDAAEG